MIQTRISGSWAAFALSDGNTWRIPPAPPAGTTPKSEYVAAHLTHDDHNVRLWAAPALSRRDETREAALATLTEEAATGTRCVGPREHSGGDWAVGSGGEIDAARLVGDQPRRTGLPAASGACK